jgi:fido (protein-threonine AMPylation protein)
LQQKPQLELSVDLLKQIHRLTLRNHFFEGYFRRRVRSEYLNGRLSIETAMQKFRELGKKKASSSENMRLAGAFRSEAVDNLIMTGLHIDAEGKRYFTREDLYKISMNPYFAIDQKSVKALAGTADVSALRDGNPSSGGKTERFEAQVYFAPVEKIESLVHAAIEKARTEILQAQSEMEFTLAVLRLQSSLIAIHPFHDGNGRAIKLLMDYLYLQRGIAVPLHPITHDYTLAILELYEQTVAEMNVYVAAKNVELTKAKTMGN